MWISPKLASQIAKWTTISLTVNFLAFVGVVAAPNILPAQGATITTDICSATVGNSTNVDLSRDSNYCVLQFKNAGSTTTWTVPSSIREAEVLIVGGGGGGGSSYWGGGGGAGGVVHFPSYSLTPNSIISIAVGGGGAGGPAPASVTAQGVIADGNNGGDSTFDAKIGKGGGGGGAYGWQWGYSTGAGLSGGSGGGTGQYASGTINGGSSNQPSYTGAFVYGNSGGNDFASGSSGGGGGAGGVGLSPSSGTTNARPGGNGGAGKSFTISGTSAYFAGGGAGGTGFSTRGTGGSSIGGSGGYSSSINGTSGAANTGSGGGGAGWNNSSVGGAGGTGGSGIVIVRYLALVPPENIVVSNTGPFTDGVFSSDGTFVTTTPSGVARVSVSAVLDQLQVGDARLVASNGSVVLEDAISSQVVNDLVFQATTTVSIESTLTFGGVLKLVGAAISASQDVVAPSLAISTSGAINLQGSNDFDLIEIKSTKASPSIADFVLNDVDSYITGNVDPDIVGVFGVPRNLEIVSLPATGLEDEAFTLSARVVSDQYSIPIQANNHSTATLTLSRAQGGGTATAAAVSVTSSNVATFSPAVLSGISSPTSVSFSVSGTGLVAAESALIHFQNVPSADASLASLVLSGGLLSPAFDPQVFSYQVTVPNGTSTITFTPTANNSSHQSITVDQAAVTSGAASSGIFLSTGSNQVVVEVTAENGATSSYTVNVFRQISQQVDWVYGSVSITEPDGSVSTASAFTDMYGYSRTSALSDDDELDADGLPQQTITLKVGDTLYLPMTSNYGNSMGYGGIIGSETHVCKTNFTWASDFRSGAYKITALKAGTCDGVFVSTYQRASLVMMSLGSRGVEIGSSGYFRTPYVNIVVERKDRTDGAIFNGAISDSSTAVWNQVQTLEIKTDSGGQGDKNYTHISGPCSVTTEPFSFQGRNYLVFATGKLTATGAGTCVIEGSQAQDNYVNAKTWSHTITFTKASQTLNFTSNVPPQPTVGSSYSPQVTSSAFLPVTLAVTTGNGTVCNISSGEVSFLATGSCTIQATQAGDSNYLAATSVTQTLVVGTANQSITFNQIADKESGDAAFRATANASSGLAVSFTTVTSNSICTVSPAGLVTIVGEGVCSVTANQAGNSQVGAAQSVTRTFTIRPQGSSAPFITAVSYGDGSLTATLIAPSYTGGNSILDYSIFAYNSNSQNVALATGCDASAIPVQCTITGLTNGEPYTLKAAARTTAGLGNLSAASSAITPLANPQAVNALTALAGNESLTITWQPPSSLGGGDFARFDIRIRPQGGNFPGLSNPSATITSITQSSYVFSGLQNGVSYDVEMITITTEPASGMNSATLQSHTARVLQTPYTRPNSPRNLAAFEVDNSVKIAFSYPDFDGGRQVSEYRVSVNGTVVCTPTQIQVCSVPLSTLTSLLASPSIAGIGFHGQPIFGSRLLSTTTQIPITVVAVNDGGSSDPATTTYNLITGSSTPPPSSSAGDSVASNLPTIFSYSKTVLDSSGDSLSITGTNFKSISEIWIGTSKTSFLLLSDSSIRITSPEMLPGEYQFILRGSFGVLTTQDKLTVVEGLDLGEPNSILRTFVDGFISRSTYLGPANVSKLKSFVLGANPGAVIKCYGSIPDRAKLDDIRLAFKRADRVCDYVQSLNPNISVVRTWVWKDGDGAWFRGQVRLKLENY